MAESGFVPKRERGGVGAKGRLSADEVRSKVIGSIAEGLSVREAVARVDRTVKTYEWWRASVPGFAEQVDRARAQLSGVEVPKEELDFAGFREKYLGMETFIHQRQWVAAIEGVEPPELHDVMTYQVGRPQRVIINTPPFHAKSATITIDYVVWRICMDPNVRIIIISESRDMARKMLVAIKDRLTHPKYEKMHLEYGPAGGFKVGSASWTQDLIYVGNRDPDQKDPTVEVLGVGSQIYGARADLIIMDDCVTLKTGRTMGQTEKIVQWIDQEVSSRLDSQGKLLLVGTRVSANDVYSALLKRDKDKNAERKVWTYLGQPAVLEYGDTEAEWVTLWPFLWDGPALGTRRDEVDPSTWNLVYQQQQVAEDSVFPEEAIQAARIRMNPGPVTADIRPKGMEGLYVVAGLDPASSGYTAIVVLAVDKKSKRRYVLDVVNHRACTPHQLRAHVNRLQDRYKIHEWRIEKNGLQTMISQDPEIRQMIMGQGGRIVEHHTGCVPDDVQILTREGWKHRADLLIGEDVLTHEGWSPLLDVTVIDAPESVYRIDTQNLSCDFTAEHRHLVKWAGNSSHEQRFVETTELRSNTPIVLSVEPVEAPGGVGVDVAALLGWYVCEGSDRGAGVCIAQSPKANPEKWAEIKGHLDTLGWDYAVYQQETADRFHVKAGDAAALRELAPGKVPRLDAIAAMSVAERDAFMSACLKGDGHGETFFNTNLGIVEAFELAAILNGYTVRRFLHDNSNNRFRKNLDCWGVRRKRKRLMHAKFPGRDQVVPVPGRGQFWCPTTESGSWVAMSNGRSFVTGNSNKWDHEFGVMSLAPFFLSGLETPPNPMIMIPGSSPHKGIMALCDQLVAWEPEGKGKTDCVMALWFADLGARKILDMGNANTHMKNRWITRKGIGQRRVINFDEAAEYAESNVF